MINLKPFSIRTKLLLSLNANEHQRPVYNSRNGLNPGAYHKSWNYDVWLSVILRRTVCGEID